MQTKIKRIIAWIAIILLASLYLTTLGLAIAGFSVYNSMFLLCLFATLVIPLLAFIVIYLFDRYTGRIAPGDPLDSKDDKDI